MLFFLDFRNPVPVEKALVQSPNSLSKLTWLACAAAAIVLWRHRRRLKKLALDAVSRFRILKRLFRNRPNEKLQKIEVPHISQPQVIRCAGDYQPVARQAPAELDVHDHRPLSKVSKKRNKSRHERNSGAAAVKRPKLKRLRSNDSLLIERRPMNSPRGNCTCARINTTDDAPLYKMTRSGRIYGCYRS